MMDDHTALAWAKQHLPLRRSDYSPALDEVRWNVGDKVYRGVVRFVAQYRCGGDGRAVMVPEADMRTGNG